ncbi:MAG: ECF transporter S component [Clostridia bacterium]|nr:ECF transporter S component [Clostridia bacterium]MBR2449350.1 ECF transporter S component [Clostridia bacterium]
MEKTKTIVLSALFTALITLSTMVIQIPMPVSGYVNLGDVFVLIGAFVLGPIYGTISAGIGSMLADLLSGYAIFAPGTLVIKALMAVTAYYIFKTLIKVFKNKFASRLVASIVAELIMVIGYFLYSCLIMSEGLVAATSIPGNLIQGAIGVFGALAVVSVLDGTHVLEKK